ncbi:RBR-type E3 ubiquitin transferase [Pleurostoma richardsiae]|uniref:RBR-type E3 ubiquitin transferase n=1 Tax=Pleurostoma richardsiae TaxID=41990 RepID=A0AA38RAB9_9PEZI|nr:RBR-type E3 ubiquitin transferase [Pleurostoma richardsiae]
MAHKDVKREVKERHLGVRRKPRSDHRHHHRHRSHNESRESRHRPGEEKNAHRALVHFKDLDYKRETFVWSVRPEIMVAKLDEVIRKRSKYVFADGDRILFFRDGKQLDPRGALGDDGPSLVYYRVLAAGDDGETWIIKTFDSETKEILTKSFHDELVRNIDSGKAVGDLRTIIARKLNMDDPNRIVLVASGGMRTGPLEGTSWELRLVRSWLCRQITIDVSPKKQYVVFRSVGREYVFQPENAETWQTEVTGLKVFVQTHLVEGVHQACTSNISLRPEEVKIIYDRRAKGSHSRVPWGCTVDFQLPDNVAEAFAADETWLLPVADTCTVCSDDKRVTEMPQRISAACEHKPTTCKDCLRQWIQSSLDTTSWDRLKCPECPLLLKFDDVRKHASREVFVRFDDLATRAALKDMPNFRWCLSPKCESGQIFGSDNCAKSKCEACGYRQCVHHNVPWHSGETCDEYDKRNRQRQKDEKASEETIKKTSKTCPSCKKDVHKWTGCNHITCVCRHEWCYICLAPYQRNQHGFLFCRHNPGCTEHDPFLEFVEGPPGPPFIPPLRVQRPNMRPFQAHPHVAPRGVPPPPVPLRFGFRPQVGRGPGAPPNADDVQEHFRLEQWIRPPEPVGTPARGVPPPLRAPRAPPADEEDMRRRNVIARAMLGDADAVAMMENWRQQGILPGPRPRPPGREDAALRRGAEEDNRSVEETLDRLRL